MGIRGKAWAPHEDAAIERLYPTGGVAAVKAATGRTKSGIVKRAGYLGITCSREVLLAEPLSPVPRMDLCESLACIQLRKWKGPVDRDAPLRFAA